MIGGLVALSLGSAWALPVELAYSGVITSYNSGPLAGAPVGTAISGVLRYDTAAPDLSGDPAVGVYRWNDPVASGVGITFDFAGYQIANRPTSQFQLVQFSNSYASQPGFFGVGQGGFQDAYDTTGQLWAVNTLSFFLDDTTTHNAFPTDQLQASYDLSQIDYARGFIDFYDGNRLWYSITSLGPLAAVPEVKILEILRTIWSHL